MHFLFSLILATSTDDVGEVWPHGIVYQVLIILNLIKFIFVFVILGTKSPKALNIKIEKICLKWLRCRSSGLITIVVMSLFIR